jgi:quinol---cytochrome-c reductase cytochrome c subunit
MTTDLDIPGNETTTEGHGMMRGLRTVVSVMAITIAILAIASVTGGRSTALATELNSAALAQQEDQVAAGAAVYAANCATCHQAAGQGIPGTFPPLIGNPNATDAEHVESAVRDGLSGPIDVLGETYDGQMPPFDGLSDEDVRSVVAYVVSLAARDPNAVPTTVPVVAEPGDVGEGRDLFVGSTRLDNGGAACASCHVAGDVGNLGGSSLGPDLTAVIERFGGEAGLSGWLAGPASPTMIPIFGDRPLAQPEIADIVAFLGDAPTQSKPWDPGDGLVYAGGAGLLVLLAGMAFAWRGMRQTYGERLRSKR